MTIEVPVEPGLVAVFARAVGDLRAAEDCQPGAATPGEPLLVPLTYTFAVAQHFDQDDELRMWPGGEPTPEGGGTGRYHAEQHFEYLRPLRSAEVLTATITTGRTWSKPGRSGTLDFGETVAEFHDADGALVLRARKVGVRIHELADD